MLKKLLPFIFTFLMVSGFSQDASLTLSLDWAKRKCVDLGFKPNTERFGNCVLQLSRNDDSNSESRKPVTGIY